MKFIHALLGILSLLLFLVITTVPTNTLPIPSPMDALTLNLLLATIISNLLLGGYLKKRHGPKRYVQAIASCFILLSLLTALCLLFNPALQLGTVSALQIIQSLLVLGAAGHFIVNLNVFNLSTHTVEASDEGRETGTVKWFNVTKGFGFITRDQGDDIFVHYRAIRGEGHRTLTEGQRVDFMVVENNKGLQAEDVIAAARGR